jgi:hypothetical protein
MRGSSFIAAPHPWRLKPSLFKQGIVVRLTYPLMRYGGNGAEAQWPA